MFNKFQMYDKFRDGENLYFDLDICIYDKVPNLIRKDLTLLYDAWWRDRKLIHHLTHLLYLGQVTNHMCIKHLKKI